MPSSGVKTCADRKSTRLNSSHLVISYAVFCLKKKKNDFADKLRLHAAAHQGGLALEGCQRRVEVLQLGAQGSAIEGCFFFNDTATTESYTLSLHDALPIWVIAGRSKQWMSASFRPSRGWWFTRMRNRSEEHTSELQSPCNLVCRLLLE